MTDEQFDTITEDLGNINSGVETANITLSNVDSNVSDVKTSVDTIKDDEASILQTAEALRTTLESTQSDVSAIKTDVKTVVDTTSGIAEIGEEVSKNVSDILETENNIDGTTTSIESDISDIDSNTSTINSNVSTINSTTRSMNSTLSGLSDDITVIKQCAQSLSGDLGTIAAKDDLVEASDANATAKESYETSIVKAVALLINSAAACEQLSALWVHPMPEFLRTMLIDFGYTVEDLPDCAIPGSISVISW